MRLHRNTKCLFSTLDVKAGLNEQIRNLQHFTVRHSENFLGAFGITLKTMLTNGTL